MSAVERSVGGFVTVARVGDVEPGTVRVVELDGRSLCIGQTEDGEWGAIDNLCTHDGGTLGEGEVDGNCISCPRHGAKFDLRSGDALTMPATEATCSHDIKVEEGKVLVQLRD